jgi:hypothetical protein
MNESYLEKCIRALPLEKQPAAREAFKAISETGDDSFLSKLLVTLEATSAYAATIPQDVVISGEKLLRELDARAVLLTKQQTEADAQREKRICEIIAKQVPQLGKALALDRVAAGMDAHAAELGRIGRTLTRLRHIRVGGLILLIGLAVSLGAGAVIGLYWQPYHAAQRAAGFVSRLNAAGVYVGLKDLEGGGTHITVEGAPVLRGTSFRKNTNGSVVGADLYFPAGGDQ